MRDGIKYTENNKEWNTPSKFIPPLLDFFEDIILDPCSNIDSIIPNKISFIFPEQDGLEEEWCYKTVYINPPYGKNGNSSIKDWFKKSYESYIKYNSEIIMLVPVATNTKHWKNYVYNKATGICFLYDTRLKFRIKNSEQNKGCPMACCFIYFGSNYIKFNRVFKNYGFCIDIRGRI